MKPLNFLDKIALQQAAGRDLAFKPAAKVYLLARKIKPTQITAASKVASQCAATLFTILLGLTIAESIANYKHIETRYGCAGNLCIKVDVEHDSLVEQLN